MTIAFILSALLNLVMTYLYVNASQRELIRALDEVLEALGTATIGLHHDMRKLHQRVKETE